MVLSIISYNRNRLIQFLCIPIIPIKKYVFYTANCGRNLQLHVSIVAFLVLITFFFVIWLEEISSTFVGNTTLKKLDPWSHKIGHKFCSFASFI